MPDIDVKCSDCNNPFTITEGEQQWLTDKFGENYKPPRRCRTCRQQRKLEKAGQDAPAVPREDAPAEERASGKGRGRRQDYGR